MIIYILELENDKYYIGFTNNPEFTLDNHIATLWTLTYTPIKLIKMIDDCNINDEDIYTLYYMKEFGIENVRGGSFYKLILNDDDIISIKNKIEILEGKESMLLSLMYCCIIL
jgi:hypothetical protein